ncbi:MAG: hypothetical protein QOG83_2156 [Alphaproteobacteria bacterium]|nr:hypothetical protein [Alphaproteobacteria bacterium]MEA2989445.1 hypothetical protein [Alphaproteobacteria bacterium]
MNRLLKTIGLLSVIGGFAAAIQGVAAHHSTTMFDHEKILTIKGKVVEMRWVNPHVSLTIDGVVAEGQAPAAWIMELTSPSNLVRAGGWSRNALKAGDDVVADFNPLRDAGKRGGALRKVVLTATGQVLNANLRSSEGAAD